MSTSLEVPHFTSIVQPVLGSPLTEPLEVVAVVLSVAGLFAGAAGSAELLSGRSGRAIQDAAANGAAAGFLLGLVASVGVALYLVLSGS
jgi:hypothetical protein